MRGNQRERERGRAGTRLRGNEGERERAREGTRLRGKEGDRERGREGIREGAHEGERERDRDRGNEGESEPGREGTRLSRNEGERERGYEAMREGGNEGQTARCSEKKKGERERWREATSFRARRGLGSLSRFLHGDFGSRSDGRVLWRLVLQYHQDFALCVCQLYINHEHARKQKAC